MCQVTGIKHSHLIVNKDMDKRERILCYKVNNNACEMEDYYGYQKHFRAEAWKKYC